MGVYGGPWSFRDAEYAGATESGRMLRNDKGGDLAAGTESRKSGLMGTAVALACGLVCCPITDLLTDPFTT